MPGVHRFVGRKRERDRLNLNDQILESNPAISEKDAESRIPRARKLESKEGSTARPRMTRTGSSRSAGKNRCSARLCSDPIGPVWPRNEARCSIYAATQLVRSSICFSDEIECGFSLTYEIYSRMYSSLLCVSCRTSPSNITLPSRRIRKLMGTSQYWPRGRFRI